MKLLDRLFGTKPVEPTSKPMPVLLASEDDSIIRRFAAGEIALRDQAIAIHRRYIKICGVRGNAAMEFMAEVDNPIPDLMLRATYRDRLKRGETAPLHGI